MARTYVNKTDHSLVLHELRKDDKPLEFHPHQRRNLEAEGYSEEDLAKSPGLTYLIQLQHLKVEDTGATQEIPKEVGAQLVEATKLEEPPAEPVPEAVPDSAPADEGSQGEEVATEAPEATKSSGRRGGRKPKES